MAVMSSMDHNQILECLVEVSKSGRVAVTREQERALREFQSCRTPAKGCRILRCEDCNTSLVLFNPCNKRGCPKCAQKNQLQWLQKVKGRILPTGHLHLVFSIPGFYTNQWMMDRKALISRLFKGVDAVLKEVEDDRGLLLGRMLVFQSHGRGMSFKPHIHCLLADGGLDSERKWCPLGPLPLEQMARSLRDHFRDLGPIPQDTEVSSDPEGWSVYQRRHEGSGEKIAAYLAHSMAGVVLRMDKEPKVDRQEGLVTFEDRHEGVVQTTTLKETTFVERYLRHIPPERAVVVRYYGLYSNRHRDDLAIVLLLLHRYKTPEDHSDVEGEGFTEMCPCCHKPMRAVLIALAGQLINYQNYGFNKGPPKHREYQSAS